MTRGFTLIETVIYIALLGLLMTGAVLTAYQILQGSSSMNVKTIVQDEGDFVLRKIEWALSGASDVNPTGSGSLLNVSRYDLNSVDFILDGGVVKMRESAVDATYRAITTSENVTVTSLQFEVTGANPKKVMATTTIKTANGNDTPQTFTITRFLRN